MRNRPLAALSVLLTLALMLMGGCTQMLDSPEDIAHALMSIVLPPPDATAEAAQEETTPETGSTAIGPTASITDSEMLSETVAQSPLADSAPVTNTVMPVEAVASTQTGTLTESVSMTVEAAINTTGTHPAADVITQTASLSQTQEATPPVVLTVGELRAQQAAATPPISSNISATAALSITSTIAVSETAVASDDDSTEPVRVSIVTDGSRLNVRSEPSASAAVIGKLPPKAVIEVIESSADGAWLQVRLDEADAPAWIAAQFAEQIEPVRTVGDMQSRSQDERSPNGNGDETERADVIAPTVLGPTEVTSTIPSIISATISTSLSLTEALQSPISVAPLPTEPTAITQPANMNVRSGPGTNYPVATAAAAGAQYKILALNPAGDWYQVELPDVEEPAWIYLPLVKAVGPLENVPTLSEDEIPEPPAPAPVPVTAAAGNASPPSSGGFFGHGVQAHMLGGGINEAINATAEMGFNWMKQQVEWRIFEGSPGAIDLSELRRIVDAASGRGINVLFSVVNAPPWAREPGFDPNVGGPPADPQTYANFVGRLAGEFCGSGLKAIEVWNEQNLHYEWGNKPLNPADYMNLLRAAHGSIKSACPSMLVISGAPTPAGDAGGVARDDFAYLEGMYQNGLTNFADGIGVHPSGYNVPPNVRHEDACAVIQGTGNQFNGPCDTPHHSWSFRSTMEGYRNIMMVYGDANKRLWATEFGWAAGGALHPAYAYANDNDFEEQAAWTVEAYQMMRNWGWVGPAFLWNLNFRVVADGTEKAQWGIVRNDYGPLPVYNALRAMGK